MTLSNNDSISSYTEFTSRDGTVAGDEDVADRRDELTQHLGNNAEFAWEDLPIADLRTFRRHIFALARMLYPNEILRIMWRENRTLDVVELAVSLVRPDGLCLLVGPLAIGCASAYQALIDLMVGMLEDERREREEHDGEHDDGEKREGEKEGSG